MMRLQIDMVPFKWKYSSAVFSFAKEDNPNASQLVEVIDALEELAFAGLPLSSRSALWVLHEENGRKDLHFIIPRQEVHTGKALNAFPPGWQKKFDHLRDMFNYRYGWARPDDPARARAWQPRVNALIQVDAKRKRKNVAPAEGAKITDLLANMALAGKLRNRADIVSELKSLGYELPRQGKDYLTVLEPKSGKRTRLKGTLYHENFHGPTRIQEQIAAVKRERNPIKTPDPAKAAEADAALRQAIEKTAAYNKKRYLRNAISHNQDNITLAIVSPLHAQEAPDAGMPPGYTQVEERSSSRLPQKIVYSVPQKTLISESRPIFERVTARGYGTRDVRYELSKINARLEIVQPMVVTDAGQGDTLIVRGEVRVPLSALGMAADKRGFYSRKLLAHLDYKRWHQHDAAAAWFARLIRLQEQGQKTNFEQRRMAAPARKPEAQYLADIYPELSCPVRLYQAIKRFFCQRPEHFPVWLSLQGIRRIKGGLGSAVINDDTIKDPLPNVFGSRLTITLPFIKTVQRLDAVINPDIPAPPHKMTVEQQMDMDRTLDRLKQASFNPMPPPFKPTKTLPGDCISPANRNAP